MTDPKDRCGTCKNCLDLTKIQQRVLACCNPPFSHVDQDIVDLWNTELARLVCLCPKKETDMSIEESPALPGELHDPDVLEGLEMPEGLCEQGREAYDVIVRVAKKLGATYTGGCKTFYSPAEWRERGEKYGTEDTCILIVVYDGGEIAQLFDYNSEEYALIEQMRQELNDAGYMSECCTNWYSAVY